MLVEKTAERRIAVLGQDDAGVIVEEAVQHYPVEPGQLAKRPGRALAQFAQTECLFERRGGFLHFDQHVDGGGHRRRRGLEFDDDRVRHAVHDRVERRLDADDPREYDGARVRFGGELRRDRLCEERVEVGAEPMRRQRGFDVTGTRGNPERAGVGDEDEAVRLDRSGPVDRLAVTDRNVEAVRPWSVVDRRG